MIARFFSAMFRTMTHRISHGPLRPTWSFSFEGVVRFLKADFAGDRAYAYAKIRKEHETRMYPKDAVKKTDVRDDELAGLACRWFVKKNEHHNDVEKKVILYLHGGSYLFGSLTTHADLMARIALSTEIPVCGIAYRLAPEHRFPAQRDDALAAFDALLANGYAPERIILAGDSAGGNLALLTQLALRDRGQQAKALLLISPWVDMTLPGASATENEPFDYGTKAMLLRQAHDVAGDRDIADADYSPTYADVRSLNPVFLVTGEAELLRDDCIAFAEKLKQAKVDSSLHIAIDMPHNPPVFASYSKEAAKALDAMATFVRQQWPSQAKVQLV